MTELQLVATFIFLVSIFLVVTRIIDSVAAALLGVVAMIIAGVMSETEAFSMVDWNVIVILVSIWIIATYFGKTGIPEFLAVKALEFSKGNMAIFAVLLGTVSGFLSMVIDNVVVVLIFAPVLFYVSRQYNFRVFAPLLFIGLCANFMGTALLLGDLPPQMLHSVTGIEFSGFIWHSGKPSSFIILTITFLLVVAIFYFKFQKYFQGQNILGATAANNAGSDGAIKAQDYIKDWRLALIVCTVFIGTIVLMSLRQMTGFLLGFLALIGATVLILLIEILKKPLNLQVPPLEEIFKELEWNAIFFYAALFVLVGALEHTGVIQIIANALTPFIQQSLLLGTTILYWVTAPIVAIVEHDAYILTMLYVIRDMTANIGIDPWPLYWALLWAGTLGSNLTIAGAPALFVAMNLAEREDKYKSSLKEFLSWSAPFVISSLIICFIFLIVIWVLPYI